MEQLFRIAVLRPRELEHISKQKLTCRNRTILATERLKQCERFGFVMRTGNAALKGHLLSEGVAILITNV
jgi:hypothetical protein